MDKCKVCGLELLTSDHKCYDTEQSKREVCSSEGVILNDLPEGVGPGINRNVADDA